MTRRKPFGERLHAAIDARGRLCVGIDPHPPLLRAWGLADDAAGVREFSLRVVEALGGRVAVFKPQSAFYERHGSAGVAALEETIAAARAADTLTLVDAKRGDIDSTMRAYADAYLADGSPLAGDAVTISPYLGFASLAPAVETALESGRGVFVLALTSNPEGGTVQRAQADGTTVAASMARAAARLNAAEVADGAPLGSVGLVVGATVPDLPDDVDLADVRGPLLAPGYGAQGARGAQLRALFGDAWGAVLPSTSREVLAAGPDAAGLRAAADSALADVTAA
ncbi:orotidine 5'-phosphate decarboxylase [Beutenbergia cavernae DSM 12333]|uniref:Orotidine 5'-phosphate decarboxylase n=1 Tax=Beutenbergia cavernae (strain ATCC BAA-8 / DSM 12333 / CCUG 43141 / JCM 11478 / NBRC 16432 / NCIMB 13614 / HKI 0122) TaxID=471853 RepID=C5C688_BEUC1|nr:orotidine-5'-phosphate decarboxylase [Beutenbergia cavernae]ACQ80294.1 orotidine 5'-phosphate decarboxylase [Beutenbergia cavernae DSM 12333]